MIEGLTLQDVDLSVKGLDSPADFQRVKTAIEKLEGVEAVQNRAGKVNVSFYAEVLSASVICREIQRLGFAADIEKSDPNPFKKFVNSMIENNEKLFGSERPDCCTLNRKTPKK